MMGVSELHDGAVVLGAVTPLPTGPLVHRVLLENPWPLIAVLSVTAILALVVGNARGQLKRGGGIAVACFAVAALLWIIAAMVETTRETLKRRTIELVGVTAAADLPRLDAMLDGSAQLFTSQHRGGAGKDQILRATAEFLDGVYRVREHQVGQLEAVVDGANVARTQARVRVVTDSTGPFVSWWLIDWRLDGDQWRVTGIRAVAPSLIAALNR